MPIGKAFPVTEGAKGLVFITFNLTLQAAPSEREAGTPLEKLQCL